MNALQGEPAFGVGESVAGHGFSEDDEWWRLSFDARGEDLLGNQLYAGSGKASDEAGEGAFGDAAVWVGLAHFG
jgi:hypothetical protein